MENQAQEHEALEISIPVNKILFRINDSEKHGIEKKKLNLGNKRKIVSEMIKYANYYKLVMYKLETFNCKTCTLS